MSDDKDLVPVDKDSIYEKLLNGIQGKAGGIFSWMQTEDGKTISGTLASIASFVVGDPSGMIFPILLQCTDSAVRKRLVKHWPDLAKRLNEQQNRMEEKFYKSEFGQKLLKDTLNDIIHEQDEDKIEFHKQFLLNTYKKPEKGNELLQAYKDLLRSLDSVQLRILSFLYQPDKQVREIIEKLRENEGNESPQYQLKTNLVSAFGIDKLLFDTAAIRLEAANLISMKGKAEEWCQGDYRDSPLEESIARINDEAHKLLTEYGINFIKFVIRDL